MEQQISFIAHEADMTRMERINKRLIMICIILMLAFFISNIIWICYENQFEETSTTITQELDSGDNGDAIINDGVHIDGESKTNSYN